MKLIRNAVVVFAVVASLTLLQAQQAVPAAASRPMGTIQTIRGNNVTIITDAGAEVSVTVPDSARLLRTIPEKKDLKDATPLTLRDLAAGDRMLVRGKVGEDGKSIVASSAVVMKQADIEAHKEAERQDWVKRGIGGLVSTVDPAAGVVTLATSAAPGARTVTVKIAKETVIRRYSLESVKFDDAKISTFDQIKSGDQLRARGTRSADHSEFAAEEIVSGTFRNIAGTINSIDVVKGNISVTDLATRNPVTVKITADSQLRKLPPMVAQGIAMRLRGTSGEGGPQTSSAAGGRSDTQRQGLAAGGRPEGAPGAGRAWGGNGSGPRGGDMQQMLNRMSTPLTLADFQKGDAIMLVATQGTPSEVTAINVLAGVEPILTAPNSNRATMLLSPWNLGAGGGGEVE